MSDHDNDQLARSEELDELLGAYALDAVDDDERRRVEDYLAVNPRAAAEVQQHREIATMLAYTGDDAPEGLWDRIAATLDEPPPAPGPELAKVMPFDPSRPAGRARRPGVRRWTFLGAVAAAVVVIVAATVVVTLVVDRDGDPSDPLLAAVEEVRARDHRVARLAADGADAPVEALVDDRGRGYLLAEALPPLPDDRTYQLWGVVGDDVISIGILGPDPDIATFTARADVSALAVTIEPAGGVVSDGNPDGAYVGELS